jgi:hypothetical protein
MSRKGNPWGNEVTRPGSRLSSIEFRYRHRKIVLVKRAILNRKNSFIKPLHGAQVGDLYMSLLHTCELNKANSFELSYKGTQSKSG